MTDDAFRSYIQDDSVCPTRLLQNVITLTAVDNIDHNPRRIPSIINWYVFILRCIKSERQLLKDVAVNASVNAETGTNNSSFACHASTLPSNVCPSTSVSRAGNICCNETTFFELICNAVTKLNQDQTSVVAVDQPLFTKLN